ncbi:peptidyl-glycine alpha-amidating monooxygenase B isoform X1 [Nerophis lumbriciformis]|uniref:peptidyl-glycine alpha-amidating monooxygenase B isoform X1 n=1 Tax=Nerophis lumbriciformis TaxID=546530 RepID=UPI002ADFE2E9|nr:peptidyl-glycine alpha-amidating monooxygenase B-like isoform X1 [Nerophis lumbriciformis]XP_061836618.1 peptidyl-glycine alpha-amidating monooxygenase B-like isoform X1 [Nerophis lumbriciformis]XP_061836619.1 peptidyl-glycine alpha-amidating monooxygenase B-like isoform X1 [Nerophis lumbriciformis]
MGHPPIYMILFAIFYHSHGLETNLLYRSKRIQESAGSDPSACFSRTDQPQVLTNTPNFSMDLRMPGVIPAESDTYLCMAFRVPISQAAYVVDFMPQATMNTVHHMLLFGCKTPVSTTNYWDCGSARGTCDDGGSILYAWARNAPRTKLPKDVGFKVGRNSGVSYFVLQIHYGDISAFQDHHKDCSGLTLRMTTKPQPFIAGIFLLMSKDAVILPGKTVTNADVACDYASYPIYPFAFRTHTHGLGKVVSGYRLRNGEWSLIGRQSPQLPQAFYPSNRDVDVKYGDILAARCMFTGEGRSEKTYIGGTSDDEMCNFYIMYYMDSKHAIPYMSCMETGRAKLFQHIPAEANIPIAVSPDHMNSMMHMEGHSGTSGHKDSTSTPDSTSEEQLLNQGDLFSLMSKLLGQSKDVVHIPKYNPSEIQSVQPEFVAQIHSLIQKKNLGSPSASLVFQTSRDPIFTRNRVHKFHQLEATPKIPKSKLPSQRQDVHLEQNPVWPQSDLQLGQVSGLAIDSDSNLVIFHRGDHHWGPHSFDSQATYQQRLSGPIQQSTILVVNSDNGNILKASGRNMFYLPHGITTDKDNNYWVTDVALHQVLKVSSDGSDQTLLSLGEAFTAGSDHNHFCQPTDVAVDYESGNIFVSDGYCNARILKFSADGKYLSEWGAGSSDRRRHIPFRIPHSLAFLPKNKEVCVADRENGRIQCFTAQTGEFVKEIKKEEFGGSVFAITFLPVGGEDGLIFAVNGLSTYGRSTPLSGFAINYSTKDIVDTFIPKKGDFKMPHDIAVTKNGSIFVGDAGSNTVFKFTAEKAHRSVKKAGIEVLEEIETFIQTKVKPELNVSKTATVQQKPKTAQHLQPLNDEKTTIVSKTNKEQGLQPVFITVLLLVPLMLVTAIGVFFCWRKNNRHEDMKMEPSAAGGIFEKIRGKAVGSLNLGNFFASHKGYSRQRFDQLSTEESDQDRNEQESSESENEEYSAVPPLPRSS